MADTFLALLFAHLMADYVFQTLWMVNNKKRFPVLLLHVGIHLATMVVVLGGGIAVALVIAGIHLIIDALKTWSFPDTLSAYLTDQFAHVATLFIAAAYVPDAFATGLWGSSISLFREPMILACGFIATILAGGPAVGLLLSKYAHPQIEPGLADGGRIIGLLERGLIFLMVFTNTVAGIGFLIAAKSILRFDTASKDQKNSEYVIIGTLASFGWALAVAYVTLSALG